MYKKLTLIIILILSFGIVSCSTKKSFKMTPNINSDYDLVDLINYATKSGNLEAIKYVVEKDKYVVEEDRRFKDRLVSSVILPKAAYYGHLEIVKYLVENGADINAKDYEEFTSLIRASINGHLEVVKYLVENGADINTKDHVGITPLIYASMLGNFELVKYLIGKGADVNIKYKGRKASDYAKNHVKDLFKK